MLKLSFKFLLSILGLLLAGIVINDTIAVKGSISLTEKALFEKIDEGAKSYGLDVTREMDSSFNILYTLRDTFVNLKENNLVDRKIFNNILKTTLAGNKNFIGIYTIWEPNALDGKDNAFKNTPGHDTTGRFIPYWSNVGKNRDGSSYTVKNYNDSEKGRFYLDEKKMKKPMIREPFVPDVMPDILLTTVMVPMIDNKGKFLGIVAIDINLNSLEAITQNINFWKKSFVNIVNGEGLYVTHTNKKNLNKKIIEIDEEIGEKIKKGEKITQRYFSKSFGGKVYRTFVPIKISNTGSYWSMVITIPEKEMFKDSRKLAGSLIFVSIVTVILIMILIGALIKIILKPLTNKLERLIDLISEMGKKEFKNEEDFLSSLLSMALEIFDEADSGGVYLIKGENVKFVDAVGYDLDFLNSLKLDKNAINFDTECILLKENINKAIINKNINLDEIEKSFDVKERIRIKLHIDNKNINIFLDIKKGSKKVFSKGTSKLVRAFQNLAISFYVANKYRIAEEEFQEEIALSMIRMLEIHDEYTKGHSENVAKLSQEIARKLDLPKKQIKEAYWAGILHDIGKTIVPNEIINKTSRLTEDEFCIIKNHPTWGHAVLKKSKQLQEIAEYVLHHHERWDSMGYPKGLKENDIPLVSQILAVADTWDAMTSKRSYRNPLPREHALEELRKNRGMQFNPEIIDIFMAIQDDLEKKNQSFND